MSAGVTKGGEASWQLCNADGKQADFTFFGMKTCLVSSHLATPIHTQTHVHTYTDTHTHARAHRYSQLHQFRAVLHPSLRHSHPGKQFVVEETGLKLNGMGALSFILTASAWEGLGAAYQPLIGLQVGLLCQAHSRRRYICSADAAKVSGSFGSSI